MASARMVSVPRYECSGCAKRYSTTKADGTLRKHGSCASGEVPTDHGETFVPWVGRCTPAADIPACERPPWPTDASRNQRTLWLGGGWSDCWVLEVEAAYGRRVRILTRDGDFVAIRARDGQPLALVEVGHVREQVAKREVFEETWAALDKVLRDAGLDWRRVSGTVQLVTVGKQGPGEYRSANGPGPAYERLWVAHMNLAELLLGGEFILNGSEVNAERLLHAAGDECWAFYRACDIGDLRRAFVAQFRQEFKTAQPWEWWAKFFVQHQWNSFSRLQLRRMLSYGNERRIPGRSCVRVLAEYYIRPDGPLDIQPVRPMYNQTALFDYEVRQ